jgi:hypothetical protein
MLKIFQNELVKENIKDRIVTEINLPTGDLVIANFFREKKFIYKDMVI